MNIVRNVTWKRVLRLTPSISAQHRQLWMFTVLFRLVSFLYRWLYSCTLYCYFDVTAIPSVIYFALSDVVTLC
jgi:hypothetical protein